MISYFDINFPPIIEKLPKKYRAFRTTKPKRDKEKEKKLKKISKISKRINRKKYNERKKVKCQKLK